MMNFFDCDMDDEGFWRSLRQNIFGCDESDEDILLNAGFLIDESGFLQPGPAGNAQQEEPEEDFPDDVSGASSPASIGQDDDQENGAFYLGVKKNTTVGARRDKLIQCLKDREVCRSDIKDKHYFKGFFESDILHLMHSGFDIQRTASGRYHCIGELSDPIPLPLEHVAVAMFQILREKPLPVFELSFRLYNKGYRCKEHTPGSFLDIERALIVGGVHPHDRRMVLKKDVFSHAPSRIKDVWETIKDMNAKELRAYYRWPLPQHVMVLRRRHYRRAFTCLRRLYRSDSWEVLQEMKRSMPKCKKSNALSRGIGGVRAKNASMHDLAPQNHGREPEERLAQEISLGHDDNTILNAGPSGHLQEGEAARDGQQNKLMSSHQSALSEDPCSSGVVQNDAQEKRGFYLGVHKNTSIRTRRDKFIQSLQTREVHFSDIQDYHYTKRFFETDILFLMHDGFDIQKAKSGGYRCLGRVSDSIPQPSENIAVAMFRLLREESLSLFELSFRLYNQGYRRRYYTPQFFLNMEKAFIFGGLHPRDCRMDLKKDTYKKATEIWEKMQKMHWREFRAYLDSPSEEHAHVLRTNHSKQAFICLRDLCRSGCFKVLQEMKQSMTSCGASFALSNETSLDEGSMPSSDGLSQDYGNAPASLYETEGVNAELFDCPFAPIIVGGTENADTSEFADSLLSII